MSCLIKGEPSLCLFELHYLSDATGFAAFVEWGIFAGAVQIPSTRLQLAPERKRPGPQDKQERHRVIPLQSLAKIEPRKHNKYDQRNHFLNDLQLKCCELPITKSICRHLEAILEERNPPARQDHQDQR